MKLNIRAIKQCDIGQVYKQIIELGEYLNIKDKIIIDEQSLEKILFDTNPYSMKGIVATIDENIVGFAIYTLSGTNLIFNPTFAIYLDELYVKPNYRGQKIGTKLLQYVANIAKNMNCKRIEWYVNDNNLKGQNFYLKLGANLIPGVRIYTIENQALDMFY